MKYFILITLLLTSAFSWELGGVKFTAPLLSSEFLSISNGGDKNDTLALRDGVGVKIYGAPGRDGPDFLKMNSYLSSSTEDILTRESYPESFIQPPEPPYVPCLLQSVGSEFVYKEKTYLVVDNNSIKDNLYRAESLCTSHVTTMKELFQRTTLSEIPNISEWDTSNVTDMQGMFYYIGNVPFSSDLSKWDVHRVQNMQDMFFRAYKFNQDISAWNTSQVTSMRGMFSLALIFNQDLSAWNVSNVLEYDNFDSNALEWVLSRPNF